MFLKNPIRIFFPSFYRKQSSNQNKQSSYMLYAYERNSKVSPHTCTILQLISLFSILESPTTIAQVSHGIHALIFIIIIRATDCYSNYST